MEFTCTAIARFTPDVPTGPDPTATPPADRAGRSLVRWSSMLVLLAILVSAGAAYLVDRGGVENSDDVSFVVPTSSAVPSATATVTTVVASATLAPDPSSTPLAAEATPAVSAEPTVAPTEVPPRIRLTPATVGIGETLALHVYAPEASTASVVVAGTSTPLLAEGEGFLFGVVGIPLNAAPGRAQLMLTLRDEFGEVIEELLVPFEVTTVDRPIDFLTLTEEQGSVLTLEASILEARLRTEQFLTFDRQRRWSGLFRVPVIGSPTTQFGQGRSINGGPVGGFHSGADIASEAGTLIQAAAPGRVSWVGEMPIRGNAVIVDHGGGVKTGYHHLQAILVRGRPGDRGGDGARRDGLDGTVDRPTPALGADDLRN